eukprot:1143374-Pelagomonas_calceolata.AAC.3
MHTIPSNSLGHSLFFLFMLALSAALRLCTCTDCVADCAAGALCVHCHTSVFVNLPWSCVWTSWRRFRFSTMTRVG